MTSRSADRDNLSKDQAFQTYHMTLQKCVRFFEETSALLEQLWQEQKHLPDMQKQNLRASFAAMVEDHAVVAADYWHLQDWLMRRVPARYFPTGYLYMRREESVDARFTLPPFWQSLLTSVDYFDHFTIHRDTLQRDSRDAVVSALVSILSFLVELPPEELRAGTYWHAQLIEGLPQYSGALFKLDGYLIREAEVIRDRAKDFGRRSRSPRAGSSGSTNRSRGTDHSLNDHFRTRQPAAPSPELARLRAAGVLEARHVAVLIRVVENLVQRLDITEEQGRGLLMLACNFREIEQMLLDSQRQIWYPEPNH